MTALSSHASSKGLVAFLFAASLSAACGGGGGKYPDPVGGMGGIGLLGTGGTNPAGTGASGNTATGGTETGGSTGSGGAPGTGGRTPGMAIPISDYGTAVIAALCDSDSRCGFAPNVAACLATNRVDVSLLTLQADVAANRVAYNAMQAGLCVDAIRNSPCTISAVVALAALPDPCIGIFTGKIALGGTCYAEGECAGSGACYNLDAACAMACCPGTCVAPTTTGGNCFDAPCPADNYCGSTTTAGVTTYTCTARATADGAVCNNGDGCAAPLFCTADANSNVTRTGVCRGSLPATGAACIPNAGCDDAHDYCNTSNVCAKLVGVGLPCTPATATVPSNCVRYAYCTGGICKSYGAAGAVCITDGTVNDCLGDQTCPATTLRCTAPPAPMACQ